MTNTTVIDEQSLVDIAIQQYGSVAGLVDLALLNGKSVTSLLQVGEVLQVGEAVNKDVAQYFKERNLKVATGAEMFVPTTISVSPTTLAFGTVQTGATKSISFTITNTSGGELTVSSITFPFATYTADWNSGTISAFGSQVVNVTYVPTSEVAQNGNIIVNSNADSGINTVAVTATGLVLKGLFFDGTNDYIKIPNSTPIQLDFADSFTFNYFIKFNSTGFYIFQEFSTAANSVTVILNNNNIDLYKIQGNQYVLDWIRGSTTIVQNQIYMITCVNKGLGANNLEIYINAVKETPTIQFNDSITGTTNSDLYIGGRTSSFNLAGNIYDFQIYDKALSLSEIESLYDFEIPATAVGNLVLHIAFETLNKVGSNIFTPELISNNNAQIINYPTNAKGIVDKNGNDIQLVP